MNGTAAEGLASLESDAPPEAGRRRRSLLGISGPKDAAAQMAGVVNANRCWLVCMSLVILLWTLELYCVQAYTLIDPNGTGPRFEFWAPKVRLVMDLLFVSALALWLPRRLLAPVAVVTLAVHLGLVTYYHFFFRPLSILTVFSNWREGLQVGQFAMDMFPKRKATMLVCAVVAKLGLMYFAGWPTLTWPYRWRVSAVFTAAYLALFAATNYVDPLNAILTTRGVARLGVIRGYTGPWLAELYYLNDPEILKRVLYSKERYTRDKLTPIESSIPIDKRLVIIQAESLDFNILGREVKGQEITPFLNRLRDKAMFYRVQASHNSGCSADADFAILNAVPASPHVNTYGLPGYKYENTLPQFLARYGFATHIFHGNTGKFYNRRAAFERMGFASINFRKQLVDKYDLGMDRMGCRDGDVLRLSSLLLRQTKGPVCHFIITLTTHTPYTMLDPAEEQLFPGTVRSVERYFNNMRYLDNCLKTYLGSLGNDTTVLIYADHPTEVSGWGFHPDRDRREYVPCFIYDTTRDLSKLQATRNEPISHDGSLNLLDVIKYLRAQVAASHPEIVAPAGQHAHGNDAANGKRRPAAEGDE